MLYQWDIGKDSPEHVLELFWQHQGPAAERPANPWLLKPRAEPEPETAEEATQRGFANELFQGAVLAATEIDSIIRRHSENWRLERMPPVDRNILRLAVFEMLHQPETPHAVVINEALEIARKFSEEDSVAFINGVLDQIRKESESVQPA